VVDKNGNKMSKSRGNVIAPQKIIQQMGADILRLWIASADYSADIRISDEIMKQLAESYRRIRNTIRFLLSNLNHFDIAQYIPLSERKPLDLWAMARLAEVSARVDQAYNDYTFHQIHQDIHHFCSVDLGGFYLDVIKDRLYCDAPDAARRLSAQSTVYDIAHVLVRLIAPIVPITAEEMWEHLPGAAEGSIHLQTFKSVEAVSIDNAAWDKFFTMREAVNAAMDAAKKDKIIGSSIAAQVQIPDLDTGFAEAVDESYEQLLIVAKVRHGDSLKVSAAEGVKCPRCYVVGTPADSTHAVHHELCRRCLDVVTA